MKAQWPKQPTWAKDGNKRTFRSDDKRVVLCLALKYGVPEEYDVSLLVYGPDGPTGDRLGLIECKMCGTFDTVVERIRKVAVEAELAV